MFLLCATAAIARPGGSLAVNHYAKLTPSDKGLDIIVALDLGEMATLETGTLKSRHDAPAWLGLIEVTEAGRRLDLQVRNVDVAIANGTGNMPTQKVTVTLHADAKGGGIEFADRTFPKRGGWREIVVAPGPSAQITSTSKSGFVWTVSGAPSIPETTLVSEQIKVAESTPPVAQARPQQTDALSRMLRSPNLSPGAIALLLGLAFWFGALHALEPGHGKTMVAAYLVGVRGTAKHALLLGGAVTFTHTISVFLMGLATMFLSQYVMPDQISRVLGIISGISIVWIGGMMVRRRIREFSRNRWRRSRQTHGHAKVHSHGSVTHSHDEYLHEEGISLRSLIALGASGGLVPCPSALVLLLSAISMGRVGLGMILLATFSLGLAVVLTGIGIGVVYAKNLFPEKQGPPGAFWSAIPVASAIVIVVIGIAMTGYSLGLIRG